VEREPLLVLASVPFDEHRVVLVGGGTRRSLGRFEPSRKPESRKESLVCFTDVTGLTCIALVSGSLLVAVLLNNEKNKPQRDSTPCVDACLFE